MTHVDFMFGSRQMHIEGICQDGSTVTVFDHGNFMESCYECVSALGTVGLTKGLTPNLTIAGKVIIIITMYLGRVGPISMAIGFSQKNKKKMVMYPEQDLIL